MARPSNTKARREQIALALERVMARRGFELASIKAVAAEAGLTPGLVHYHFPHKQAILLELIRLLSARLAARLETRLAQAPAPGARLEAFLETVLARGPDADASAAACWVAVAAAALREPEVAEAYAAFVESQLELLSELVRGALRAHGKSTRQARPLAVGLFATVQGYFALGAAASHLVPVSSAASTARALAAGVTGGAA
jgi:TetR/AcrR family transcriptional repressor of bet genes